DVTIQAQILILLRQLSLKRQMAVLFISHDLNIVGKLADEIVLLRKGHKIEQAGRDNFFQNPKSEYAKELLDSILPILAQKSPLPEASPLLRVKNLTVKFPIKAGFLHRKKNYMTAVDNVNFEIVPGETFALVGES